MIPVAKPQITQEDLDAVRDALASGQLAQGERVAAFERRFAEMSGVREAIAVSTGTAALHIALLAHGVGPGDEVITTPFSFAATANVVLLTGARPVFADIDPVTYNLDPDAVERAITPRTKAIMPVHLYGNPANLDRFMALAKAHNLALIEDACQAHLALYKGKQVGGFGTGAFSFYATKNMTTGEGGMITTDDPEIAARSRLYRSHGQRERYVHVALGDNLRMTDFQGALGLSQLERLPALNEQRRKNARLPHQPPEGCRHDACGHRRRRARLPPVHYPRAWRPRPVGQHPQGARHRHRCPLSDSDSHAAVLCREWVWRFNSGGREGRERGTLAARASGAERG